jgi:hypothetical protein
MYDAPPNGLLYIPWNEWPGLVTERLIGRGRYTQFVYPAHVFAILGCSKLHFATWLEHTDSACTALEDEIRQLADTVVNADDDDLIRITDRAHSLAMRDWLNEVDNYGGVPQSIRQRIQQCRETILHAWAPIILACAQANIQHALGNDEQRDLFVRDYQWQSELLRESIARARQLGRSGVIDQADRALAEMFRLYVRPKPSFHQGSSRHRLHP